MSSNSNDTREALLNDLEHMSELEDTSELEDWSDFEDASDDEDDSGSQSVNDMEDDGEELLPHPEPYQIVNGRKRTVVLQRNRHRPFFLANDVCSQLKEANIPHFLAQNRRTIRQWWRVTRRCRKALNDSSSLPSVAQMKTLIKIISKIFFFGKLIRVKFEWEEGLIARTGASGETTYVGDEGTEYWVKIAMDPADEHLCEGTDDYFASLIGTLIHECIHAFISHYACAYYCTYTECEDSHDQVIGLSGHGSAFIMMLTHIEWFAQTYLGEDSMNMGIDVALVEEYGKSGCALDEGDVGLCHPRSHDAIEEFFEDLGDYGGLAGQGWD